MSHIGFRTQYTSVLYLTQMCNRVKHKILNCKHELSMTMLKSIAISDVDSVLNGL